MEYAFWNTIHDGRIEAISGSTPGNLKLTVGIEYICGNLNTAEPTLSVTLFDCTRLAYIPNGKPAIHDTQAIAALKVVVLSAWLADEQMLISCAGGMLEAVYQAIEVRLMEGNLVSQSELEAAADRFWTEWSQRIKKRTKGS